MTAQCDFKKGDTVYYPSAPGGIAQVDALLRTNVEIIWRANKSGRVRRKRLHPDKLAELQAQQKPTELLLPMRNPFYRAIREQTH